MAVIKAVSSKAGIGQALDYVTKEEKTEDKLVSGLHCEPDTVKDEMQATKELWEKTGGRTYKHFVQSYHKDEKITPEQAHRNALQLAENTSAWKGFEVLVATHKDKKHIHTHFIVNSVNFEDGHKLQWSSADLQELKERCNAQSREQGLHVSEKGKTFEGAEREETVAWKKETYQLLKQAEQGKVKSYVQDIALAVLDCKETATSRLLERLGVVIRLMDVFERQARQREAYAEVDVGQGAADGVTALKYGYMRVEERVHGGVAVRGKLHIGERIGVVVVLPRRVDH